MANEGQPASRVSIVEACVIAIGVGGGVASLIVLSLWQALFCLAAMMAVLGFIFQGRVRHVSLTFAGLLVFAAIAAVVLVRPPSEQLAPSPVARHRYPRTYVGPVWARVTPAREHVNEDHYVILSWGPKTRRVRLRRLGPDPVSLLFEKTAADDIPLWVRVSPRAKVTFGEGEPPDSNARDINQRWTSR